MKTNFSDNEVRFLILIIVLSFIRGTYNLYILYKIRNKPIEKVKHLIRDSNDLSLFNIVQMLLSTLYLFASIYFVLNGKVKSFVFGLICLYMFSRGSLYFVTRFRNGALPFLTGKTEDKFIYFYFSASSIITFIIGFYFTKQIFFK